MHKLLNSAETPSTPQHLFISPPTSPIPPPLHTHLAKRAAPDDGQRLKVVRGHALALQTREVTLLTRMLLQRRLHRGVRGGGEEVILLGGVHSARVGRARVHRSVATPGSGASASHFRPYRYSHIRPSAPNLLLLLAQGLLGQPLFQGMAPAWAVHGRMSAWAHADRKKQGGSMATPAWAQACIQIAALGGIRRHAGVRLSTAMHAACMDARDGRVGAVVACAACGVCSLVGGRSP